MSLHIRETLRDGVSRAASRSGLILVATFFLMSVIQAGVVWVATSTYLPLDTVATPAAGGATTGPGPGGQLPELVAAQAALVVGLAGGVLTVPVQVVSIRTLVSGHRSRIPEEFVFYRLGRASVNVFIGSWGVLVVGVVVFLVSFAGGVWVLTTVLSSASLAALLTTWLGRGVLVAVALVLLLPTFFYSVSMTFVSQEIAVRDENVLRAVVGSWRLARGNRVRLAFLAVLPVVPQTVFSFVVFRVLSAAPAQFVVTLESSVVTIVVQGIMAAAYVRLTDEPVESRLSSAAYGGSRAPSSSIRDV